MSFIASDEGDEPQAWESSTNETCARCLWSGNLTLVWSLENDPNQQAYVAARISSRSRTSEVLLDENQGRVVARRRACSVAWSLIAQGVSLALVHSLVHSHTDMDRKHGNQKLVIRSAGVSTHGSHLCLITHQQDINTDYHHLPTTSPNFPSRHGVLLTEET
jgi:hypothetical protein